MERLLDLLTSQNRPDGFDEVGEITLNRLFYILDWLDQQYSISQLTLWLEADHPDVFTLVSIIIACIRVQEVGMSIDTGPILRECRVAGPHTRHSHVDIVQGR